MSTSAIRKRKLESTQETTSNKTLANSMPTKYNQKTSTKAKGIKYKTTFTTDITVDADYEKYMQEQMQQKQSMRKALQDMVKELPLLEKSEEKDPRFGIPKNEVTLIEKIADRKIVSTGKSADSDSTYKSGYIPAIDEGSSVSSQQVDYQDNAKPSSQTKPLDVVQGGSDKNLDAILHAITSLGERIKHLEAVPPILQQANQLDDISDEDSAEDSTGTHWGMSTIKEIRRHYEVGDRLADGDVLSFVSAKTLRHYQSNDALLNRVQSLMARFESVIHNQRSYPRLQEIQSKGLQKMMEMLHLKSRLLHFALSHPMNVANIIEITELVYLLCEVEKIFLEEGLFDSNFEVATNFIQPFVQSNTFADITEKARSKKREKAVIKTAFVGKIQKPNKMKEKFNKPYTSQNNNYSKSYKSNSNFQKSGDSKPKYNNNHNNSGGSFNKDL